MPRVAFSAALSLPRSEPGTVPFDRVLLNDGDHYDPETGKPESGLHRGNHAAGRLCSVVFSSLPLQTRRISLSMLWFGQRLILSSIYSFSPQLGLNAGVGRGGARGSTALYWGSALAQALF